MDRIVSWMDNFWGIIFPLVLGCLVAYVLNIIMKFLEKNWFPDSPKPLLQRTRRGVCLFISIFLIIGAILLIIRIVVPELMDAFAVIGDEIPVYFEKIQSWIVKMERCFRQFLKVSERCGLTGRNYSRKLFLTQPAE